MYLMSFVFLDCLEMYFEIFEEFFVEVGYIVVGVYVRKRIL